MIKISARRGGFQRSASSGAPHIMPLHPWQYHHLALGNRKGRGERISSLQCAVCDIMGEDWNARMRSGVTNVVDVYTDVPTDHFQ